HLVEDVIKREITNLSDDPIVGEYLNLVGREEHALEEIAVFDSAPLFFFAAKLFAHSTGALSTMVAIGNVEIRDSCKSRRNLFIKSRIDPPDCVDHTVRSPETKKRLSPGNLLSKSINSQRGLVRYEDGSCLRPQSADVTGAIVFFILSCSFVLSNDVSVIFINRAACHDSSLLVVAHGQAVKVKR